MVTGEGAESDLSVTILDGVVECDLQESIQGERRVGWRFSLYDSNGLRHQVEAHQSEDRYRRDV